jgi:hypothetical protein
MVEVVRTPIGAGRLREGDHQGASAVNETGEVDGDPADVERARTCDLRAVGVGGRAGRQRGHRGGTLPG